MFHPTGLASLVSLVLLAERVAAAPAPTPQGDGTISWGGCGSFGISSTDPNFQCGSLDVPMDYSDASAGTARLAVIKYVATAPKKGTIFINPGGPGGSGLEFLSTSGFGQIFSRDFQGSYDIVSWDPRGVGHTFPGDVTCFDSVEEDKTFWDNTVAKYINETISGKFNQQDLNELYSQVDSTERKVKDFTDHCQNGPVGPYLKYIGTSSTIRDLVSLGDAIVGKSELIDYWGFSYGTVLGFNFLNMFPERAGRVVLDGVADPDAWISYELLRSFLADTEKTYSGLTDGCAAAGRAGCKLIEITGDNASGDDVKALINNAHDAALQLYRDGVQLPIAPGHLKAYIFGLLFFPETWSGHVNGDMYQLVVLILQAAKAHNITVGGGSQYNVPSGNFTFNPPSVPATSGSLTSYTQAAICGADNFNDAGVIVRDVFDTIVDVTREITPTFGTVWTLGYNSYGWPVRSVEPLPPFSPKQLKYPVLLIGNTADPVTPLAGAQHAATLLGDNSFLVEQLGFGHTSLAQASSCTLGIVVNYFESSALPDGSGVQCPVDDPNLFPVLSGNTAAAKRSNFVGRWW